MISDITFGQFIDTSSFLHKADPRMKLLLLTAFIVFIFIANSFCGLFCLTLLLFAAIITSRIPLKMYLKNIKTILPVILITALLNVFYSGGGKILFHWKFIEITAGGLERAAFMSLRIILLILASAVLSYTTSPTSLTNAIESILSPLKFIGLTNAVHTVAMTMTIALRFIPTLIEETEKIMNAQKARGADLESGGLIKRIKALLPILIPLLISSVRRAYELAEAMECRCYNGGKGRTKYKIMKFGYRDLILLLTVFAFCVGTVFADMYSNVIYSAVKDLF